jgi:hypothetical protein
MAATLIPAALDAYRTALQRREPLSLEQQRALMQHADANLDRLVEVRERYEALSRAVRADHVGLATLTRLTELGIALGDE